MRWLLITTAQRTPDRLGTNPGDAFARMGIEKLIRAVDPAAEFDLMNKEDPEDYNRPRDFDKAVMCGMPCVWSLKGNECQNIHWWTPIIRGWPTARKKDFMVLGAGEVHADQINDIFLWASAVQELIDRSFAVTVRQPVICHPQIIDSICPSAFTLMDLPRTGQYYAFNLMLDGGHFGYEAGNPCHDVWPDVSKIFQSAGWRCVAHTRAEKEYAESLGWQDVALFHSDEEYLDFYTHAGAYFGNRCHGAAVVAAHDCPSWNVTHDSRLGMVKRLGGKVCRPHELDFEEVKLFASYPNGFPRLKRNELEYPVRLEWEKMRDLLRRFIAQ